MLTGIQLAKFNEIPRGMAPLWRRSEYELSQGRIEPPKRRRREGIQLPIVLT